MKIESIVLLIVLLITSCDLSQKESTLDGAYEAIGYGRLLVIQEGKFQLLDNTSSWCESRINASLADFREDLFINNDTLNLKVGITIYQFIKIDQLPNICSMNFSDSELKDPEFNFEVLEETFSNNYAFFDLRKVKWDSLRAATQTKITQKTTEAELYSIMKEMLDTFKDGHISIKAPEHIEKPTDTLSVGKNKPNAEHERYDLYDVAYQVGNQFLKFKELTRDSRFVRWGFINDKLGYLQINSMSGHANLNISDTLNVESFYQEYEKEVGKLTVKEWEYSELRGISDIMNIALKDLANTEALVLDIRFNRGGQDLVALEIIRHFNNKRQIGFSKKVKRSDEGYTPTQDIYIEVSNSAYTKPVFLLISQQTASAAEILALSSLSLTHFTRIGSHTEGIFSDELTKRLPNGWSFGLSNEVYLDRNGKNYESLGIPVNIELGYPSDQQTFLESIANSPDDDWNRILNAINSSINFNPKMH